MPPEGRAREDDEKQQMIKKEELSLNIVLWVMEAGAGPVMRLFWRE